MNAPLKPWYVSAEDFPEQGGADEKLEFLISYAVLAPSSHNTQPWMFRVHSNVLELFADLSRALPVADPQNRELIMSCGAALKNLIIAIDYFGYAYRLEICPDPDHPTFLARVRLGFKTETFTEEILMFHAIQKRHTNRLPFREEPIPESLLATLQTVTQQEGAWLDFVRDEDLRFAVADLIATADRMQWSDKAFRRELADWLHSNRCAKRDGIPGYASGLGNLKARAQPLMVRTFDLGKGRAARDREIAIHSPVLALLRTEGDTIADWMHAGQALESVLLRARVEDVWASFLNPQIEVGSLRTKLAETLGCSGFPQILLRLGFGSEVKPTPRRSVAQAMMRPSQSPVRVHLTHSL
jgi:hypothetical protein